MGPGVPALKTALGPQTPTKRWHSRQEALAEGDGEQRGERGPASGVAEAEGEGVPAGAAPRAGSSSATVVDQVVGDNLGRGGAEELNSEEEVAGGSSGAPESTAGGAEEPATTTMQPPAVDAAASSCPHAGCALTQVPQVCPGAPSRGRGHP